MKNLKTIFTTTLLGVICLAFSSAVASPGGGTSSVVVVNSTQQPVPVSILDTPSINIANTPSITLSGTPSVSLAPGASVSIANTPSVSLANTPNVNVANTPTVNVGNQPTVTVVTSTPAPLLARDVDNPARQPFQAQLSFGLPFGQTGVISPVTVVPAGKQLVVEHVSVAGYMPTGQKLLQVAIWTTVGGISGEHVLTVSPQGTDSGGVNDFFTVSQDLRLYSDPGSTIYCSGVRDNSTSTGNIAGTISGYLVNVP